MAVVAHGSCIGAGRGPCAGLLRETRIGSHAFGRQTEPLPFSDDDPDADLRVRPDETSDQVLAFYSRARSASDRVIDELDLEATGTAWFGEAVSLRWVLIHMLEETARHAGHVDILRELIDGKVGDHKR